MLCSRRVTRSPYFAQLAGSARTCFAAHGMTGSGRLAVGSQRVTGVAQRAGCTAKPKAVGVAASLADQRQVGVVEGVADPGHLWLSGSASRVSRSRGRRISDAACQSSVRVLVEVSRLMMLNSRASCALETMEAVARCRRGSSLLIGQGFLAAPVRATRCLVRRCPLTLPLAGSGRARTQRRPHHRRHQVVHRRVLASEHRALLQEELDAHAALRSASVLPSDAGHRVAGPADPMLCTTTVSPSRTSSAALQLGALVSLPDALSVNTLLTGVCSSWRSGFWSKLLTRT